MNLDEQIRVATYEWLKKQEAIHSDILPRTVPETGFEFESERITTGYATRHLQTTPA